MPAWVAAPQRTNLCQTCSSAPPLPVGAHVPGLASVRWSAGVEEVALAELTPMAKASPVSPLTMAYPTVLPSLSDACTGPTLVPATTFSYTLHEDDRTLAGWLTTFTKITMFWARDRPVTPLTLRCRHVAVMFRLKLSSDMS